MPEPTHINTVEAKNTFNALIAKAERDRKPVIIEKRGAPVAVILDYQTYRENNPVASGNGKKPGLADALKKWHAFLKKNNPRRVTTDSVELIRELREERSRR